MELSHCYAKGIRIMEVASRQKSFGLAVCWLSSGLLRWKGREKFLKIPDLLKLRDYGTRLRFGPLYGDLFQLTSGVFLCPIFF